MEYIKKIFGKMTLNQENTEEKIKELGFYFQESFPFDYIELLKYTNGAEGDLNNGYFALFSIQEIIDAYEGYELKNELPRVIFFGTDRGGMAYGFDFNKEKKS